MERNLVEDFVNFMIEDIPTTYQEAMVCADSVFWKEAVNDEYHSIMSHHTWIFTSLPPRSKALGCKCVFRKNLRPDGSIEKLKAKLVAKGFKQKGGL